MGEAYSEKLRTRLQEIESSVLLLKSPKHEVRYRIMIDSRVDVGEDGKKQHLEGEGKGDQRKEKKNDSGREELTPGSTRICIVESGV